MLYQLDEAIAQYASFNAYEEGFWAVNYLI